MERTTCCSSLLFPVAASSKQPPTLSSCKQVSTLRGAASPSGSATPDDSRTPEGATPTGADFDKLKARAASGAVLLVQTDRACKLFEAYGLLA